LNKKSNVGEASASQDPDADYSFIPDLGDIIQDIPDDTIISREIYRDEKLKAILFGFAAGQELSEHTASRPALLHFLQGEAQVTLGQDQFMAQTGTWVHMPAHLRHSVFAVTPTVMLLLMI
jgi:quercetin dioxygenase-like cupin family protein